MKKLPITGLEAFIAIARQGSIRGAATVLRVQPSTVSHQLKALEDQMGVSLFTRSTRSVGLTDAGQVLLQSASPAMDQLRQAIKKAQEAHAVIRGELRINMPYLAYDLILADRLNAFEEAYPGICFDLTVSDRFADIIAENFHAGIRFGHRLQDDMIAVPLSGPNKAKVFGSPDYIAKNGKPKSPADLSEHSCIRYRFMGSRRLADWDFQTPDGHITVEPGCTLSTNSQVVAIDRAVRGHGIVHVPEAFAEPYVANGSLVPLLSAFSYVYPALYLYYPREARQSELLRAFVRFFRVKS